jgi:hypothetical protein
MQHNSFALHMQAEPFVTIAYQMPLAVKVPPGETVSITAKAHKRDPYAQTLKLKVHRSGAIDARLTDPAGDRYRLLIDPTQETVSLMDPLPMPLDWAGTLTRTLMGSVCGLAALLR